MAIDRVVQRCCTQATFQVLAERFWDGDVSKVNRGQVFADTYGMNDEDMIPFTVAVNARLNQLLAEAGRQPVQLATGPGQVVGSDSTVGQFVDVIYDEAMAQHP